MCRSPASWTAGDPTSSLTPAPLTISSSAWHLVPQPRHHPSVGAGQQHPLITGVLQGALGTVNEMVWGSFRHLFDWRWARRRPGPDVWLRLLMGRIFLVGGVLVLGSLIASI